jgi:hypothetical protein
LESSWKMNFHLALASHSHFHSRSLSVIHIFLLFLLFLCWKVAEILQRKKRPKLD